MDELIYESINKIMPDIASKERMLCNIIKKTGLNGEGQAISLKRRPIMRAALAFTIVSALLILGVFGTLATGIYPFNLLHDAFFGDGAGAEGFNADAVSIADGIEVRLLSAVADETYVYAFMEIRDVEADRLDEALAFDIIDGKQMRIFGGTVGNGTVNILNYNNIDKTATVAIQLMSDKAFKAGDIININLHGISSGHNNYSANFDIDLSELAGHEGVVGTTDYASEISSYTWQKNKDVNDISKIHLLAKDEIKIDLDGINWCYISNIGFIEDKLHIQICYTEHYETYNGGSFFMLDNQGNEIHPYFSAKIGGSAYSGYEELVFNIAPDTLYQYKLAADCSSIKHSIKGGWLMEFMIESILKSKTLHLLQPNEDIMDMTIRISPVSVEIQYTASGYSFESYDYLSKRLAYAKCYLIIKDGSRVNLKYQTSSMDIEKAKGNIKYVCQYFNLDELEGIELDGSIYYFE